MLAALKRFPAAGRLTPPPPPAPRQVEPRDRLMRDLAAGAARLAAARLHTPAPCTPAVFALTPYEELMAGIRSGPRLCPAAYTPATSGSSLFSACGSASSLQPQERALSGPKSPRLMRQLKGLSARDSLKRTPVRVPYHARTPRERASSTDSEDLSSALATALLKRFSRCTSSSMRASPRAGHPFSPGSPSLDDSWMD